MKRTIRILKEMREKAERVFIEHSLIKRASLLDSPVPNVDVDLDAVAELNEAISVLENHTMQKPSQAIN